MDFRKNWGLWLGVVIVVIFIALVVFSGGSRPAGVVSQPEAVSASDHIQGSPQAKAVLIEYGDYQCPACALYEPLVAQLAKDFSDSLAIVFRHFPLVSLHPNATAAARASEAADLQGKFWLMHDLLYSRQVEWEKSANVQALFVSYAGELGMNKDTFTSDFNSDAVKDKVETSLRNSLKIGLNGTPTFFLNGRQLLVNPRSYEEFKALIQAEIAKP